VDGNPMVTVAIYHPHTLIHHHAYRTKVLQAACSLFVDYQSK